MTNGTDRTMLNWASSKMQGRISEIAVLAPLKRGLVPGERRTYEERAMAAIDSLAGRVEQGLPNELNLVPSIHFGRITLIRPEQYLVYSDLGGKIDYYPQAPLPAAVAPTPPAVAGAGPAEAPSKPAEDASKAAADAAPKPASAGTAAARVPLPIDEYREGPSRPAPDVRSFLLTSVEFDGDLKVYFRDIDVFLSQRFDSLFENCEDYPGTAEFEPFWLWIRRYQITTQLFYAAYPDLSVVRIRQLELFKRRFDEFVAKVRSPTGARVASMDEAFDAFLRRNQQVAFGFPAPGGVFEPNGQPDGTPQ